MKSVWGSDLKVLEKIHPGIIIDSTGTLYYTMMDVGNWFGGKAFYVGKISPTNSSGRVIVEVDQKVGSNYSWPWNGMNSFNEDATFSKVAWVSLAPCMAQEVNGTTDYVHAIVYVLPSRWWNTSSGPDTEGLLFVKIKKSDLSVAASSFVGKTSACVTGNGFGDFTTLTYNRNVFTAVNNVSEKKTVIFWPHKNKSGTNYETEHLTSNTSHRQLLQIDNDTLGQSFYGTVELGPSNTVCLEPRLMVVNNKYHLVASSGYTPVVGQMDYNYSYLFAPISTDQIGHFDVSGNTAAGCNYHCDFNTIGGKFHVLAMTKTSRIWSASYISWNTSYVVLALFNFDLAQKTVNCPNENCIAVFPVTTGTHEEATSATTLYKNTHMFVTYNNYIIYAYCYPGKKTHLILGAARYGLDANNNMRLLTKREFTDNTGDSFGHLTNCSRIIFMDVKNDYLWIVFASVDNKTFFYFCIKAQDVIDHAA
jgi:hypothetical protein